MLVDKMEPAQPPPDVEVRPTVLEEFAGRYRLAAPKIILENSGEFFTLVREGNRLIVEAGPVKLPLFAESETTFYSKVTPAKVTFVRNGVGKLTGFIMGLAGVREYQAARME